jgi:hypothetical protein
MILGGDADALTHCIAGCKIAHMWYPCFGPDHAYKILQGREPGNSDHSKMDILNNEMGFGLGRGIDDEDDCAKTCRDAHKKGLLYELDNAASDSYGKGSPPNERGGLVPSSLVQPEDFPHPKQ